MANSQHLLLLKQGVTSWNKHWKKAITEATADPSRIDLSSADLRGLDLSGIDLSGEI